MKIRERIPYGVASTLRIGSLRDPATGQAMTPTFADGDAKITQDDGVGTDNMDDAQPAIDGTDIVMSISAAEATALATPGTNGRSRVIQLYDQTNPKAWLDLDIILDTEGNSHLATFPNGVIYGFTPAAIAAGSITLPAAAETGVHPVRTIAVVVGSDDPLDLGASAVIDGWTAGTQVATMSRNWSRTPTGTLSSLRVALYANAITGQTIADSLLARAAKGGSDDAANVSVAAALAGGFFRINIAAGVLTVLYADGTTAFERTLTRTELDAITAAVP